jgi:hypothetical protein
MTKETIALAVAATADAFQVGLLPLFAEGAFSPVDDALDLGTFIILVKVLGWHPLLLPTMVAELIPLVDLAPTWTMAILIIMRRKRATSKKNDESRALTSQSNGPVTSKE